MTKPAVSPPEICIGIDWADQEHAVCVLEPGQAAANYSLKQSPEAIDLWHADLRTRFAGRKIGIALEQSRGALIWALMKYDDLVLYPVNPKQLARFREVMHVSGSKSDPEDALLLATLLQQHHDRLSAWEPDDEQTRLLGYLVEDRRHAVDQRAGTLNRLKARLKQYFPQALDLVLDLRFDVGVNFLRQFDCLETLQAAPLEEVRLALTSDLGPERGELEKSLATIVDMKPLTTDCAVIESGRRYVQSQLGILAALNQSVRTYDSRIRELMKQHADAEIFDSLPGAGPALAPRMLVAFGTDRDRYCNPAEIQQLAGIAPVTIASGKTRYVRRRWACSSFLQSTFQEFANCSRNQSSWASAYYDLQRSRGKAHQAAVRALAFKWIRVIYRCWKDRKPYDELAYCGQLMIRQSPIAAFMASQAKETKTPTRRTKNHA
jgi:transposase